MDPPPPSISLQRHKNLVACGYVVCCCSHQGTGQVAGNRTAEWQTQPYHMTLHWRQNERVSVSDHQPHDCLLNCLFRHRSEKTSKLRVTGLCGGNSPLTGEFPAQMASNAENVSIWWRHHGNDAFTARHLVLAIVHNYRNIVFFNQRYKLLEVWIKILTTHTFW